MLLFRVGFNKEEKVFNLTEEGLLLIEYQSSFIKLIISILNRYFSKSLRKVP